MIEVSEKTQEARRTRATRYYQKHREKILQKAKNNTARKAYQAQYYRNNREKYLQYNKDHAEEKSVYNARYRENHLDKLKSYRAQNYQDHVTERRAYAIRYAKDHPEQTRLALHRRRARQRETGVFVVTPRDLHGLLVRFRFCCSYCSRKLDLTPRSKYSNALHWDHVMPIARGGRHSIGNLLPVCRFCNQSKRDKFLVEWKR